MGTSINHVHCRESERSLGCVKLQVWWESACKRVDSGSALGWLWMGNGCGVLECDVLGRRQRDLYCHVIKCFINEGRIEAVSADIQFKSRRYFLHSRRIWWLGNRRRHCDRVGPDFLLFSGVESEGSSGTGKSKPTKLVNRRIRVSSRIGDCIVASKTTPCGCIEDFGSWHLVQCVVKICDGGYRNDSHNTMLHI